MTQAFARPVEPTLLHHYLGSLSLPVMVDVWYYAATLAALGSAIDGAKCKVSPYHPRRHWRKSLVSLLRSTWPRGRQCRDRQLGDGGCCTSRMAACSRPTTSLSPTRTTSRALTEIDIHHQGKVNRRDLSLDRLSLNEQLLPSYARQIIKRSAHTHYAIVDPDALSRNELRFLLEQGLTPLAIWLRCAVEILLTHWWPCETGIPQLVLACCESRNARKPVQMGPGSGELSARMNTQAMELCVRMTTYLSHRRQVHHCCSFMRQRRSFPLTLWRMVAISSSPPWHASCYSAP